MLFKRRTIDDYTNSLAAYMPGGELFASKSIQNSNFRKLLRGMAGELFRANGLLHEYAPGIIPDETTKFIEEWEAALGIPDTCFKATGTTDERRRDILVKLASLGVQTVQDFVDLAATFAVTITVTPGLEEIQFPLVFPVLMFTTETEARFTIVVEFTGNDVERFPYEFPILFGNNDIAILECLFNRLKPANCNLIFQSS